MTLYVGPVDDPDKYELAEVRSRGGEGEVWKGSLRIDSVHVPVAIKLILPGNVPDFDEWFERWDRQAELLRSLKHPGLMTVREVFAGPGPHRAGESNATQTLCLVMNWVEGPTLVEWVSRNPHRHALESIQVIGGLASAVDYLHSGTDTGQPILHRDIKPSNVILAESGPLLVDFGFVRAAQSDSPMTMVGTPSYIAPEAASGLGYSAASDCYALGATAFYALTGEPPTLDDMDAMYAKLDATKGLEGRRDLHDLILSMLASDPQRRPSSAVGWAQNLATTSVVGGFTQVASTNMATASTPPPAQTSASAGEPEPLLSNNHKNKWLIGAGAVVVLLLFVAIMAFTRQESTQAAQAQPDSTTLAQAVQTTSTTNQPTMISVPSVIGMTEDEAVSALSTAGITDVTIEAVGDPAPPGTVLDIKPSSGSRLNPGDSVALSVATTQVADVPGVIGESEGDAIAALAAVGMLNVTVARTPSVMQADSVVELSPAAGAEVALDTPIVLTVADPIPTPDLLSMTVEEATAQAAALGAKVRVEATYDPAIPAGALFDQVPTPGEPMTETLLLKVGEEPSMLFLEDLGWADEDYWFSLDFGQGNIDGDVYTRSLILMGDGNVEFNVSRDFDFLQFTVGYDDFGTADDVVRLDVFLDGEQIHTSDHRLGSGAVPVKLDISGGLRLSIETTGISGGSQREIVFLGQAELLGDPAVVAKYRD